MYHLSNTSSRKGFTLVEIMIVVVIIGILAAIGLPQFAKVRSKSIEKTIVNDARVIGSAVSQLAVDTGDNTIVLSVANVAGFTEWTLTATRGTTPVTEVGRLSSGNNIAPVTINTAAPATVGQFIITNTNYRSANGTYVGTRSANNGTGIGLSFNNEGKIY